MQFRRFLELGSSVAIAICCFATGSYAQEGIRNPQPLLKAIDRAGISANKGVREAAGTTSRTLSRERDPGARLEMRLKKTRIHNPAKGAMDTVWLRGYVDMERNADKDENLVSAPLIEAIPGQTVRIDFYNHLLPWDDLPEELQTEFVQTKLEKALYDKLIPGGACDHEAHGPEAINTPNLHPGCFNATNNHFHGSWVNAAGNSDNVLRLLHPGAGIAHEYEYNIPADHPAGTFWYHPHVHGSTAIQVASGMAGALIVRGDRWPEPTGMGGGFRAGDIDVLLRKEDSKPIPDRVFLLQQIQYKCFLADGSAKPAPEFWNCADDDIGAIVDYGNVGGPNWGNSGRFTTVNGHVADVIGVGSGIEDKVVAGQPERWRFIHAGFADTIKVQIYPRKQRDDGSQALLSLFSRTTAVETDPAIDRECEVGGPALAMFEIAADGLTRMQALETDSRILQPGYRSDVLVSFPQPPGEEAYQDYCVIDVPAQSTGSVEGSIDSKRLLFTVRVERNGALSQLPDAKSSIRNMMVTAALRLTDERASQKLDVSRLPAILDQLYDDLKLEHFSPHDSLIGTTVTGEENAWSQVSNLRLLRFNRTGSEQAGVTGAAKGEGIGHKRFSRADYEVASESDPEAPWATFKDLRFSDRPDELIALQLGNIDEWRLRSADGTHPFHIHINPFQIVRATRLSDGVDLTRDQSSQYFGLNGVFKDTIAVEGGVEVVVRSHYERYVGRFVLHCHILPHEDGGMMRTVEIFEPGTPGGLDLIEKRQEKLARILDLGRKAIEAEEPGHSDHHR